jgi:hypothetical protein
MRTRDMDVIRKLGIAIASAIGGGLVVFLTIIFVFGIPLAVLALMRIMGWEWWTALLTIVLMQVIPLLGQLGYAGLALYGAFCLASAHFSWREAVSPAPAIVSFKGMPADQFRSYTSTIVDQIESACTQELATRMGLGGKITVEASNFCKCTAQVYSETISQDDMIYQEEHGDPPAAMATKLKVAVAERCRKQ